MITFFKWLFNSRHYEIKIVLATLAVLILLPIMSVVVIASSGFALVSKALAAINPITHLVEIFDPNGNKTHEMELSTTWPTTGYVSDEFGTQNLFRQLLGLGSHSGIDIANEHGETGAPITPFLKGKVTVVDDVDDSDCGINVVLDHGNSISSQYCHLLETATLVGNEVVPGDIIGYMGDTGTSTGPHLHFQTMLYGIPINPRTFMLGEPTGTY